MAKDIYITKKDGKWGFIDNTGKIIIPPQYDDAYNFSDGLTKVKKMANMALWIKQAMSLFLCNMTMLAMIQIIPLANMM